MRQAFHLFETKPDNSNLTSRDFVRINEKRLSEVPLACHVVVLLLSKRFLSFEGKVRTGRFSSQTWRNATLFADQCRLAGGCVLFRKIARYCFGLLWLQEDFKLCVSDSDKYKLLYKYRYI